MKWMWIFVGLGSLTNGIWAGLAPGSFYDTLATFGVQNDHLVRDLATYMAPLGIGFLIASVKPSWRMPVAVIASLQNLLHIGSHFVDHDMAQTAELSWTTIGGLVVFQVVLLAMARSARDV